MRFFDFPRNVRFTPVPNPVFGPLLEQIDDISELKCTLRIIWMLHQKKGSPRHITLNELLSDRVLSKAFSRTGDARSEITRALTLATRRGTLTEATLQQKDSQEKVYALNRGGDRINLTNTTASDTNYPPIPNTTFDENEPERPNIFGLYEDNIGMLTPMIADELKKAEKTYPEKWVEDAFREAVTQNKRSWRYIIAILDRWDQEGRTNGEPRGHTKKTGRQQQYLRRR